MSSGAPALWLVGREARGRLIAGVLSERGRSPGVGRGATRVGRRPGRAAPGCRGRAARSRFAAVGSRSRTAAGGRRARCIAHGHRAVSEPHRVVQTTIQNLARQQLDMEARLDAVAGQHTCWPAICAISLAPPASG